MNPTALSIPVDRNSPVPLYFQVAQQLEHMIESGDLGGGNPARKRVPNCQVPSNPMSRPVGDVARQASGAP